MERKICQITFNHMVLKCAEEEEEEKEEDKEAAEESGVEGLGALFG